MWARKTLKWPNWSFFVISTSTTVHIHICYTYVHIIWMNWNAKPNFVCCVGWVVYAYTSEQFVKASLHKPSEIYRLLCGNDMYRSVKYIIKRILMVQFCHVKYFSSICTYVRFIRPFTFKTISIHLFWFVSSITTVNFVFCIPNRNFMMCI